MIFWYDNLYMDDAVRKQEKECKKIIEKRSVWQKLPWKKNYYVIVLASNEKNLFEIMNTDQMFFRYYGYKDLYILGVAEKYEGAVEILRGIMVEGYDREPEFDPRQKFARNHFFTADRKGKE